MTAKGEKGHEEQCNSILANTCYRLEWKSIEDNSNIFFSRFGSCFYRKALGLILWLLYIWDLWFDDCNWGIPQGALCKSLGHEQQPGHTLLEQGPGMMLSGVIPYSLLSNLASAVLILQWLDSLRNLHGYNCSKPWCRHTCFTIKVYTWAVSPPLSERYAR